MRPEAQSFQGFDMNEKNITSVSLDDLATMKDRTRADAPEGPSLEPGFWETAKVRYPDGPKERLTVRFDQDMVAWFTKPGQGLPDAHECRPALVLRSP